MSTPTEFKNVTVTIKANVYFEGKVVSHSFVDDKGVKRSAGLVYPGAYTFTTGVKERMDVTSGACVVKIAGDAAEKEYTAGDHFLVAADSSFDIAVTEGVCEYLCTFG